MPTMPESWAGYRSVAALVKGECCGFRPNKYSPPTYCCNFSRPCTLMGEDRERCTWFERCLLPIAPKAVAGEYGRAFPACAGVQRRVQAEHGAMTDRECPDCGGLLAKRQRVCGECRERRERVARRSRAPQLSP